MALLYSFKFAPLFDPQLGLWRKFIVGRKNYFDVQVINTTEANFFQLVNSADTWEIYLWLFYWLTFFLQLGLLIKTSAPLVQISFSKGFFRSKFWIIPRHLADNILSIQKTQIIWEREKKILMNTWVTSLLIPLSSRSKSR